MIPMRKKIPKNDSRSCIITTTNFAAATARYRDPFEHKPFQVKNEDVVPH
jgi:hypothetical protein